MKQQKLRKESKLELQKKVYKNADKLQRLDFKGEANAVLAIKLSCEDFYCIINTEDLLRKNKFKHKFDKTTEIRNVLKIKKQNDPAVFIRRQLIALLSTIYSNWQEEDIKVMAERLFGVARAFSKRHPASKRYPKKVGFVSCYLTMRVFGHNISKTTANFCEMEFPGSQYMLSFNIIF